MALEDDFEASQARVKQLAHVTGSRPGMLDFKGRAKYDAWSGRSGTSKLAAMQADVDLVRRLVAENG
jgi:carboxylesterase